MSEILNAKGKDVRECIALYNAALRENDFAKMARIESELKEAEKAYATQSQNELFDVCKKSENPVLKAVELYTYPILAHKRVMDDGVFIGFELVEDRVKQLDLVKLCKWCDMSHLWEYKVERLGNLLCMRVANELGLSKAQVAQIEKLYYMNALARKAEMTGAVPTSNTQLVKLLQEVIDSILFVAGDNPEMNKYRCNNRDVAYFLACYTKRGRKELSVSVAKNSYVHTLVMDVMHRIVTGKVYDVEFKMVKDKGSDAKAEKAKDGEVKVSEKKKVVVEEDKPMKVTRQKVSAA